MSSWWSAPKYRRALELSCGLAIAGLVVVALRPRENRRTSSPSVFEQVRSSLTRATSTSPRRLQEAPPVRCSNGGTATQNPARNAGNPRMRRAAQQGLQFVANESIQWTSRNSCYGCHVQAVTVEALSVGRQHQYDISNNLLEDVLRGILTVPGGARQRGPVTGAGQNSSSDREVFHGAPYIETATAFGGAAFARFDLSVDARLRDDLLAAATQLIRYQAEDGSLPATDTRFPVVAGPLQATTQALQTWHAAYDRTADSRWLEPIRKAERYVQARARVLLDDPAATTVDLNYAVMGLYAAGAQPSESVMRSLERVLRGRQGSDGGWSFRPSEGSNAFATGQTLYALRVLGNADEDAALVRGMGWLVEHQQSDGGWSHDGRGKAEAMWAVFGLVSMDLLSLSVTGLQNGQHTSGTVTLRGTAVDNSNHGVASVELAVDDTVVARACGSTIAWNLDTSILSSGVHAVDLIARNTEGRVSRRRVEFYTGNHYLVDPAARFESDQTILTLRNVAPATQRGTVRTQIYATRMQAGTPVRDHVVWSSTNPSAEGPLQVRWNGNNTQGQAQEHGRYIAVFDFVDGSNRSVQSTEVLFSHESLVAQQQRYGQLEGAVAADNGAEVANQVVELINAQGQVVQSTATTRSGNYRFNNIDRGHYRVRVSRAGFRGWESDIDVNAPASAGSAHSRAVLSH